MTVVDNPETTPDRFPPLHDRPFQPVDPAYRQQLRLTLVPWIFLVIPAWFVIAHNLTGLSMLWQGLIASLPLWVIGLLIAVWVPRRYRHTGYQVRARDLHLRTGALWRQTTSVTINRIQHLELTRGPMERLLGLARLSIFTAGGSGQDLAIPGLKAETAEQLRQYLLQQIAETGGETRVESDHDHTDTRADGAGPQPDRPADDDA